jgi:hypothetical protein
MNLVSNACSATFLRNLINPLHLCATNFSVDIRYQTTYHFLTKIGD